MGLQHNFNSIVLLLIGINFVICTYFIELILSQESRYDACKPNSCGTGPNISYPFFIINNGSDFCGHPGFEVECEGGMPIYKNFGGRYIMENVVYENDSFLLVSTEVTNSTCPKPFQIFKIDRSPVEFATNHADLFFFFNCTASFTVNYPKSLVTCDKSTNFVALVPAGGVKLVWRESACQYAAPAPIQLENGEVNLTIADIDYKKKLKDGFSLKWVGLDFDCEACQRSGGRCGFLTARSICFCPDGPHHNNCNEGNRRLGLKLGLGTVAAFGALMVVAFVFRNSVTSSIPFSCWENIPFSCWEKGRAENQSIEAFLEHYGSLAQKRYTYSEVKKMTRSFNDKLGQGGCGEVFKGKLPDGSIVAVKLLTKSKTNGEDFINEVGSIGRTSHVNIVTLLGFCFEGSNRALIYEFMSGGSLEKYIYEKSCSKDGRKLGWQTLFEIAIGIARGLEYLHRGCNTRILHFDIKPHNILLDQKFCPKISDFGLAKICPQRESIISMTGTRGTVGYIAPEVFCRTFGGVSHKSDVYSYGMMVFEMVGGRKNACADVENSSEIFFPDWIHKRLQTGEELGLRGTGNEEERSIARKMILVSSWCIQNNPSDRPPMDRVVEMLQGSLESIPIPPKPHWVSPPRFPERSMRNSTSTLFITS